MSTPRPDGIKTYDDPAGGWGATKALAETLARQQIIVQGARTLLRANQPQGFDCPGCAWPDPKHTSSFEFCENGAKAITWESTAKRVGPDFFAEHSVQSLWERTDHWLEGQGRITHPMRYDRESDRFEAVEWQDAFDDIGLRMRTLAHPDEAEFYTSGRASNQTAFLFQLFARNFGTNNFPDCSNMCHEATSVGLPRSIGIGKATVTLEDYEHTDLIISMGHNPGTNHPRMMTSLRDASRSTTPSFAGHTAGFEALREDLASTDWPAIESASGLKRSELEGVARIYATAQATILCYGMGITQHRTGTANVQQIMNLLLLKGNIGRAGAGVSPLRGHSNVQGDRTVGITERPSAALLDKLRDVFHFEPPRAPGHSVVETIKAMRDGQARAIICLGGNLAVAASDPLACMQGFRNLELAVHIATKLNRTHLLTSGTTYLFPCLGRIELDMQLTGRQSITVEDSMSMVHASSGFLPPPSDQVRSEPAIVGGIAKAVLREHSVADWDRLVGDYGLIREKIELVFPDFEGYNERILQPGASNSRIQHGSDSGRRPAERQISPSFEDWKRTMNRPTPTCSG